MKIIWRIEAERQLQSQIRYLRQRNPYAADRMIARIDERLELLRDFPAVGSPSRRGGVRELLIRGTPYIAVYRFNDESVEILRFFHVSQNR